MIAKLRIDFHQVEPMTREQFDALRFFFPDSYELKDYDEKPITFFYGKEVVCEVELAMDKLIPLGINPTIVGLTPQTMVVRMKDRIAELVAEGVVEEVGQYLRGGIVQVSIPDMGLLLMDEVCHLDDSCTDELQRNLDEGWRILAVCPPNAARRPDYILGRRKSK